MQTTKTSRKGQLYFHNRHTINKQKGKFINISSFFFFHFFSTLLITNLTHLSVFYLFLPLTNSCDTYFCHNSKQIPFLFFLLFYYYHHYYNQISSISNSFPTNLLFNRTIIQWITYIYTNFIWCLLPTKK